MRPIQLMIVVYVWFCETYKQVSGHYKKAETEYRMIKEFFCIKTKKDGKPLYIQAHLAAPTHERPFHSPKSLHFAKYLFENKNDEKNKK